MDKGKLLPIQIFTLTASTTIGVSILFLQRDLVEIAGRDAWISMLLGGLVAILAGLMIYYLARYYKNLDLPEMALAAAGPILGRILLLPLTFYVLLDAGLTIRVFAQALTLFLLDRTPVIIITGLIIIVMVSVVVRGINAIAGVIDLLFPFFIFSMLLLIAMAVTEANLINLKPVLYKSSGPVLQATLPAYSALLGYGSIAYVMRYVPQPQKVLRWFLGGIVLSVLLFTLLTVESIAVFGTTETGFLMFPILFLTKAIEVQAAFVERLEAFMVLIWIPAVFTSASVFCFGSVRNFSVLLKIPPQRQVVVAWLHIPALLLIAQYSQSEIEALYYSRMADYMGITQGLVFVPLLLILTFLLKRRGS